MPEIVNKSLIKLDAKAFFSLIVFLTALFGFSLPPAPGPAWAALPRPAAKLEISWQLYSPAVAVEFQKIMGETAPQTATSPQSPSGAIAGNPGVARDSGNAGDSGTTEAPGATRDFALADGQTAARIKFTPENVQHANGEHAAQENFLLLLTLTTPSGSYLYAPFSLEQTAEEAGKLVELARPLAVTFSGPARPATPTSPTSPASPATTTSSARPIELVGSAGSVGGSGSVPPRPVKVFYPPGSKKFDQYSEVELPVYEGQTVIALLLPAAAVRGALGRTQPQAGAANPEAGDGEAPQPVYSRLNISGLLCSSTACTPVRQIVDLMPAGPILDELPPKSSVNFRNYREISGKNENNTAKSATQVQNPAHPSQVTGTTVTSGANPGVTASSSGKSAVTATSDGKPGMTGIFGAGQHVAASYAARFTPVYFQQGLEVSGLGRAALFGFLAGLILNFMPCVLPVISLKFGMLAGLGGLQGMRGQGEMARRSRARFRTYSLFFSLGVLAWFAALFAIIGFAGMLWGQFFQSRNLLLGMAIILFLLALSLFGVFRLPLFHVSGGSGHVPGQSVGGSQRAGSLGSLGRQAFAGGLLATLLATPCSGPLLGGVLGWAVGQPLFFLAVTLLCVALGMASPFIVLSINPGLARFLPRPGGWTLILEKLLGFLLLGTVLYLLSMLPGERIFIYLGSFILLGLAAWLWGRRSPQAEYEERLDSPLRTRKSARNNKTATITLVSAGIAFLAVYLAFAWQPAARSGPQWREFSAGSFEELLGRENLLLDFTADWCINCRALEATTLSPGNLAGWADKYSLTYMKVDITANNPAGEDLLAALGSASIPLLAIFPAGEKQITPTVLRDLISAAQLEEALAASLKQPAPVE